MGLTDLCFIEIDHIKTEKKVDMAMSILRDDRNVAGFTFCFWEWNSYIGTLSD